MSSESPVVELYSSDGYELSAINNLAIPTGTRGIISLGSDGTTARFILIDGSARQVMVGAGTAGTSVGGVLTVQGIAGGTPVPVSGTVTAANASVSTTGAAPPASATYMGGSVTTGAPIYTSGQMSPLSLTNTGLLRIDGSGVIQPVSGTITANQGTANTLANAWATKITDATNGPVAVKAASTAAVATDPALVVAISPNNSFTTTSSDVTATGALGALNAVVSVIMPGKSTIGFQLAAGTLIGTIVCEMSIDGGTTWNTTYFDQVTGNKVSSVVFLSANSALASTMVGVGGSGMARIRVSAYTSGTANVTVRASNVSDPSTLTGGIPGSSLPPITSMTGGSVTALAPTYTAGTLNPLSITTGGLLRVDNSGVISPVSGTITANQGTANTLANAWSAKITDATNGPVAVKAASTAAVATDPALVVAISPNNSLTTTSSDTIATGTLNALNATITLTHPGQSTLGFQLAAGTLIGTIVAETSFDGGVTWNGTYFNPTIAASPLTTNIVFISANSATGATIIGVAGIGMTRVRVSAFTSGTATGTIRASRISDPSTLTSSVTGSAVPPFATQFGGSDGANLQSVRIKNSSTAALATDPALVVSLSPNSPLSPGYDVNGNGTIAANGASVVINTNGLSTLTFTVVGTWVGTLAFQFTVDGTHWVNTGGQSASTGLIVATLSINDTIVIAVGGFKQLRIISTAWTSGTATITYDGGVGVNFINSHSLIVDQNANGPAAVKPASTAAVATDPALVVAISPNNPISVSGTADTVVTGALGALNATVQISTAGQASVGIQVAVGTLAGTIIPEFSWDGGTNWSPGWFVGPQSLGVLLSMTFTNPNPAQGKMIAAIGGTGLVRVRVSAYTSGTCNITLRASQFTTDMIGLAGEQAGTAVPPMVIQVGGSDGTNLQAFNTTPINGLNPLLIQEADPSTATSYPDQGNFSTGINSSSIYDSFGNLQTRGTVLTDEGSFRDDFSGAALTTAITGNLTFTNGSTIVTGTNLQTQIREGQYIKKAADSEANYVQVAFINSATSLTLVSNYIGTSAAAASVVSNWQTVTPAGGSIAVATSFFTLACGTTANSAGSIRSLGDYLPYSAQFYAEVSQRIANQTLYMGFQDVVGTPNQQAIVQFTGTNNTQVNFITSFSSATSDTQITTVTIPNGSTTTSFHLYKIDLSANTATLSIDGIVVAKNNIHLPSPYTVLFITAGNINGATAPGSNTSFTIDNIFWENLDRIQIDQDFTGEQLPIQTIDSNIIGTLTALNTTVVLSTGGYSTVAFDITGTWTGIITIEAQTGDGAWWAQAPWVQSGNSLSGGVSANSQGVIPCGGFAQVRLRMSSFTSGTAIVCMNAGSGTNVQQSTIVGNPVITATGQTPIGTAPFGNPLPVGGVDPGGLTRILLTDTSGRAEMVGAAATGTAVAGNPVLIAGFDGTNVQTLRTNSFGGFNAVVTESLIGDGVAGHGPVAVKAASTAAVATDPALVVAISPNNTVSLNGPITVVGDAASGATAAGNPVLIAGIDGVQSKAQTITSAVDRAAMTAGVATGLPIVGQSSGVARIATVNRFGYVVPGYQTLLALDLVEGTTINSWLWTSSATTMAISQTTGVLTLNSGAITTANTSAIITSNRQFAPINQAPIACSFKALMSQTTNAVNEIGFGAPVGNTAIITNGAFFRINASGTIHAVISFNGTETVSASLGNINTTSYYIFIVDIGDQSARFIMEDETGIPLVDTSVAFSLSTGEAIAVSHIPVFARVYVTATAAGTAPQIKIAGFQAYQYGINTSQPFSEQLGAAGRQSNIGPTTFTQTYNGSLTANPVATTPTTGAAAFAGFLGGTYALNMTATAAGILSIFSYQVPSPYTLVITEVFVPPPVITTAFSATATAQNWYLILANNATLSSSTVNYIYPLGTFGALASAPIGTVFNGQPLQIFLKTPITANSGVFVFIGVRMVSGAATGVYTGNVLVNGYFD